MQGLINIKKINDAEILIPIAIVLCTVFTGGFYWYQCIAASILLLIYCIKKSNTLITWQFAVIIIMFLISVAAVVFSHGDKHSGIYELEKILCLLLGIYSGSVCKNRNTIKTGILVSAIMLSVAGILAITNFIDLSGFVFMDGHFVRLQSFTQYANTTAVVLACGYFVALDEQINKKVTRCIAQCIMLAFFLTFSKGGILIFLLIETGLIISNDKIRQYLIVQNLIAIISCCLIEALVINHLYILALLIAIGTILTGCYDIKTHVKGKILVSAWISLCILAILGLITFSVIKNYDVLSTLKSRIVYMSDALKLIKDNWLTGIGPGAWKFYQYTKQSSQYYVQYVHNGWLQFALENSVVFVLVLIVLLVCSLKKFIKEKNCTITASLLMISLHSLIDFDFGYGIILIIFGLLIGSGLSVIEKSTKIKKVIIGTISVTLLCYSSCEYVARRQFEYTLGSFEQEKTFQSLKNLCKLCPYDSKLQLNMSVLDKDNAKEYLDKANNLSPLDPVVKEYTIKYLIEQKSKDCISLIFEYLDMMPKQEQAYINAYAYIEEVFNEGICSPKEYEEVQNYIETRQKEENVVNRNQLIYDN